MPTEVFHEVFLLFLILFRDNVLQVKDHYQYHKLEAVGTNETDVFSREPFIVRFHSPATREKTFQNGLGCLGKIHLVNHVVKQFLDVL